MPIGPARMPLFDHLGELRRRLVIILVTFAIATVALYFLAPHLIDFLVEPFKKYIPDGQLYIMSGLGGFTVQFKVGAFFGLLVSSPVIIWQFIGFFLPALKPNERKWALPTFLTGCVLFFVGMIFCYFVILDPAFEWMTGQTEMIAQVLPDAENYLKLTMLFEIAFGLAFELPIVVFYLIVFNIVPYKKFRESWRVVYVVLMVVSAMFTPDANPITMILMFAALLALYEGSLLLSRVVLAKKIAAQNEKMAMQESDD